MATYFMFGKYGMESVGKISAERTSQANAVLAANGGKILSGYALLGKYDLVLIVDLPGTAEVIKTSVALSKLLGVGFMTAPAVTIEEFDKLVG